MNRRHLLRLAAAVAASPFTATRAQQPPRTPRIGYLVLGSAASADQRADTDAFEQGLRELGYVVGRTIVIEYRYADSRIERLPAAARELVELGVDLIVANSTPTALAARRATATIPIVAPVMGDPVEDGLVQSLARPGGNVTGMTFVGPLLAAKRLDLLKQALPGASRVGALWHRGAYGERTMGQMFAATQATADGLQLELVRVAVDGLDGLDTAFAEIVDGRADAVLLMPSPLFFNARSRIVRLAAERGLPMMAMDKAVVAAGGLMSYGLSVFDLIRRGAVYVDRILKGASPADLPVEQPTRFELSLNMRTARALGLTLPLSFLAQADEVIE